MVEGERVFFNDTATTEIYTLSLHDALPILVISASQSQKFILQKVMNSIKKDISQVNGGRLFGMQADIPTDRKSTRLNSSHANISYAVFCLKKNNSSSPPSTSTFLSPFSLSP